MRQIVEVVLPFFAMVAVGYAAARWRLIALHGNQGLTTFVYWFGLPRIRGLFHGFGAAQSNNGFLAVPLMPALFGEAAIAPVALT